MKRIFLGILSLGMLFALGLFAGCSSKQPPSALETKELNVFFWTEYISESVVKQFEEETGVKVNFVTYSSNEDMMAKVKSSAEGTYDIVVPSDYAVKMMKEEGLLLEIDKSKISNLSNIEPSYLNRSFDPNNQYSVPYMAGAAAIVINKKKVSEKITSFAQIINPKYKNSIVALDDSRAVIGAAANSMGYSFNPTDDAILEQVAKKVQELKPNIKLLDSDSPKTAMLNGETSIGYMWNAEIAICLQESQDFEVVFPNEGCYLFLDNMCVLKGAKNKVNAEKFINFVLRDDISAKISQEYPYTNPNKAAVALLPDSYKNNLASNIPAEVFANGQFIQDVGSKVEKYDEIWTKFTK
ncbi:MAG: spermidine/putrescine ABC transporter substrate-binding protein [Endomicrobium sp.]|jgi:spermidine/putrescine-binding protein|nr:spermidine/putrescine ABC transporter substrate-binding protein [Endomicrobium sp.]